MNKTIRFLGKSVVHGATSYLAVNSLSAATLAIQAINTRSDPDRFFDFGTCTGTFIGTYRRAHIGTNSRIHAGTNARARHPVYPRT